MKKILYLILSITLFLGISACQDFEELNIDPNNPTEVVTTALISGVEKAMLDDIYDNWFSGRQSLLYSQYWAQRNYTEEDRYQIRESVNNSYFYYLYQHSATLNRIIKLNTDEATAAEMSPFGPNANQIAAARTLKAWLFLLITDTWGSVPYSESGKLVDAVYQPKYDAQQTIYTDLLKELKEAAAAFDEDEPAFTGGDHIFDGDASQWKKFANSLRCRVAIHLSKTDPNWKTYISEAVAGGVFESNADNAVYTYSASAPNECNFYRGFFVEGRNDFTITRPFADILKGQRDTLNNKQHPWEGTIDPRLSIYTTPRGSNYIGIPYGIASSEVTAAMRNTAPTWYTAAPPLCLHSNFAVPLMTYAELQFILSEYNGFSATEYEEGIRASLDYWSTSDGIEISADDVDAYVTAVSPVTAEKVAIQKYIDLYMNGTEAWTEYRRTGYPTQLLKPDEISCKAANGTDIKFNPLSDTKGDILARVKYPTNESTLNGASFEEAIQTIFRWNK